MSINLLLRPHFLRKMAAVSYLVLGCTTAQAAPQLILALTPFHDPHCAYSNTTQLSSLKYHLPNAEQIAPGECIIYQITLSNLGTTSAQQVQLNAPIPDYTHLVRPPQFSSVVSAVNRSNSAVIQLTIADFAPEQGETLILSYSVKVD